MGRVAIKLPDIGEGIAEAELTDLHVKVGDLIAEDAPIADVMTDKSTVEVPTSRAGRVLWIAGEVGDVLAIGADLIHIDVEGVDDEVAPPSETTDAAPEEPVVAETDPPMPEPAPEKSAPVSASPTLQPRQRGTRPLAPPSVRRSALDQGIDLRLVPGSGPAGRITHEDLAAFRGGAVPSGAQTLRRTEIETIKVAGLRKRISERMEAAKARAPHITIVEEVDVTDLDTLRKRLNGKAPPVRLTLLPFVMRALVRAVADHPEMNAHFDDDANIIQRHAGVHIGIATQTPNGLVVPVVRHAEALGLSQSAAELARLAEAARDGNASREELSGSTITISSLGPLGGLSTTPILNRPEVAIVGVNKIAKRPLWDGCAFVPREIMNLSCSFDHRVIDGWDAAVFIQRLKELLENPALAFMEDA